MNVKNVFPSPWLYAEDLQGRRVEVEIVDCRMDKCFNQKINDHEMKLTIGFGRSKRLILNKTQALTIAQIVGSPETDDWIGKRIALRPGVARNRKPTIIVEAASVPATAGHLDNGDGQADDEAVTA